MFNLLEWAEKFVATPSVSRDGNGAVARLAMELLSRIGLAPRLVAARHEGVEHFNVIADVPVSASATAAGGGLILLTHLDTVPPGDFAAWTATGGDPFRPTRVGDQLFGLGSADAKVDLVCKAAALAEIDWTKLHRPVRVVGTFAEEIGLIGARHLVASGDVDGFRYALVGEPSELVGIRAHKGYAVFEATIPLTPLRSAPGSAVELEIRGRTAHSSTPQLGSNAIEAALERLARADVRALCALEGGGAVNVVPARATLCIRSEERDSLPDDRRSDAGRIAEVTIAEGHDAWPSYDPAPLVAFLRAWQRRLAELERTRDADFDPAHTVGNLGRVQLVDDTCVIGFDLRPIPGIDALQAVAPLERCAKIRLVRQNPPLHTAPDGALVRAVKQAQRQVGLEPRIATKATCTEAGVLAQTGHLEVVVLGAGVSVGNVHRPNEHTLVSQLDSARNLYRELIQILCKEVA